MDVESLFGATKVLMMAISFKIIFMESESMFGRMVEFIMESG